MATNRDLLKEAIADAKAVKEMAIANAKTALEEAFTPHLKEMLSAKIQEMDENETMEEMTYEEDSMEEGMYEEDDVKEMNYEEDDVKEGKDEDEVDLEELLAELEEEEVSEELNEAEEEEEVEVEDKDEEESEGEEGEPLDLEDMTDEDLKKMIEDVIADMVASGELEGGDVEDEEKDEEVEMSDEEEEVDLAELLKEIEEEMKDDMEEGKENLDEIDPMTGLAIGTAGAAGMSAIAAGLTKLSDYVKTLPEDHPLKKIQNTVTKMSTGLSDIKRGNMQEEKENLSEIDPVTGLAIGAAGAAGLGAIAAGLTKLEDYVENLPDDAAAKKVLMALRSTASALKKERLKEELDESVMFGTDSAPHEIAGMIGAMIPFISAATGIAIAAIRSKLSKAKSAKEVVDIAKDLKDDVKKDNMSGEVAELQAEIKSLKSDLNEAVKETNATNLLNAKLLYTNKIFKAKNLNESQKVKVLSSFDKANTVKETKLVYETLSEGLKVKKSTIKENLGRASKSTTVPTTKKPIMESNDVFARMQKLAGIK